MVQYEGTLIDGTRFDGTYDELGNLVSLLSLFLVVSFQAGPKVSINERRLSVYVLYPFWLAYGENPRPGGAIQPNDMLIFKIALEK